MTSPVDISTFDTSDIGYKDIASEPDYKAVKDTLTAWTRSLDSIVVSLTPVRGASPSKADRKKLSYLEKYFSLVNMISRICGNHLLGQSASNVRVLSTEDAVIQSAATFSIMNAEDSTLAASSLYVSFLVTAPWNLDLGSSRPLEEASLVRRGAGTTLILTLAKKAFFDHCEFLYLIAAEEAMGFYERIGMTPYGSKGLYYLDLRIKISAVFVKYVEQYKKTPLVEPVR